jgi:hypothetical protein
MLLLRATVYPGVPKWMMHGAGVCSRVGSYCEHTAKCV